MQNNHQNQRDHQTHQTARFQLNKARNQIHQAQDNVNNSSNHPIDLPHLEVSQFNCCEMYLQETESLHVE